MKTKLWLLSAFVLVTVNLAWIWRLDQFNKEFNRRMSDNSNSFIQVNKELYLMNRGWEFSLRSNDQPLPSKIPAISANGGSQDLGDYIGNGRKLVLVLSDRHCSTCVEHLLFTLKNEVPEIKRDHLLVLFSAGEKTRPLWRHRQMILTGVQFLEIADQSLQLAVDSLEIPYFFVTGPEHLAGLSFTPYPSLEVQTREYLKEIKQRYFN
jgi:hypothetical protein